MPEPKPESGSLWLFRVNPFNECLSNRSRIVIDGNALSRSGTNGRCATTYLSASNK
jgi:hypothetical protein